MEPDVSATRTEPDVIVSGDVLLQLARIPVALQLSEGLRLDLSNTLAGHAEALANFLECSWFFSTKATRTLWDAPMGVSTDVVLVFGRETAGLPDDLHQRYADRFVSMPIESPRVCDEPGVAQAAFAGIEPVGAPELFARTVVLRKGGWRVYASDRSWLDRVAASLEEQPVGRVMAQQPVSIRGCPSGARCSVDPAEVTLRLEGNARAVASFVAHPPDNLVFADLGPALQHGEHEVPLRTHPVKGVQLTIEPGIAKFSVTHDGPPPDAPASPPTPSP